MNTTLIEFTDMKWQRGDISFLFNGLKTGKSDQVFFKIRKENYWVFVNG